MTSALTGDTLIERRFYDRHLPTFRTSVGQKPPVYSRRLRHSVRSRVLKGFQQGLLQTRMTVSSCLGLETQKPGYAIVLGA